MKLTKQKIDNIVDLFIIAVVSLTSLGFYYVYKAQILSFAANDDYHILIRTLFAQLIHFSSAGLGSLVVFLIRREKLTEIGFNKDNLIPTLKSSIILAAAFILLIVVRGSYRLYYPFRGVWVTDGIMVSPLPILIIGFLLCVIFSGMFEGLNYAYISRKLNSLFEVKNVFLSPGPILMAILAFVAHSLLGLNGWQYSIQTIFLVYGMLVTYEKTHNIIGCVIVFGLFWNAL